LIPAGTAGSPTKRCLPRFDRTQPAGQMKAREKDTDRPPPAPATVFACARFRVRQIEGRDPFRMFELRRMNQRVAHVERCCLPEETSTAACPGVWPGAGKTSMPAAISVGGRAGAGGPCGRYVIPNGGPITTSSARGRKSRRLPAGSESRRTSRTQTPSAS